MEKSYQNISYFFVGILICAFIGFHFTYTVKFSNFEGLSFVHHFHGAMMMAWFAMLILQPILIRTNRRALHRQLGKVSYVLVPLLLYSIFLVSKISFLRNLSSMPRNVDIGGLAVDLPNILVFAFFYGLAIIYRKKSASHLRYMIGTSLLMIGPGVGRAMIIFGGFSFPTAIITTLYLSEFVALAFLLFDYFKGNSIKPFVVIMVGLIFLHICWNYQMSSLWQGFGEWFVGVFY